MPQKSTDSSKKTGRKLTGKRPPRGRAQDNRGVAKRSKPSNKRPWYAQYVKSDGVPCWVALYYYTSASSAEELYRLDLMGYGDIEQCDPDWPEEEQVEFDRNHHTWKMRKDDLEEDLLHRLRNGELIAKGFSSAAPLDALRQTIAKERWEDFTLDLRTSTARGANVVVTQILIFEANRAEQKPTRSSVRIPLETLRKWYLEFVRECEHQNVIADREDDFAAARSRFGERVTRDSVRQLRKELAPESWKRRGRRIGVPNRKGHDTTDTSDT